jgi:hypothetical protein
MVPGGPAFALASYAATGPSSLGLSRGRPVWADTDDLIDKIYPQISQITQIKKISYIKLASGRSSYKALRQYSGFDVLFL